MTDSVPLTDLTADFLDSVQDLLARKNHDYRSPEDPLAGFNEVADALGLSFETVWAVYYYKHVRAILSFVRSGGNLMDESIQSRLQDVAAYPALLVAHLSRARPLPAIGGPNP